MLIEYTCFMSTVAHSKQRAPCRETSVRVKPSVLTTWTAAMPSQLPLTLMSFQLSVEFALATGMTAPLTVIRLTCLLGGVDDSKKGQGSWTMGRRC